MDENKQPDTPQDDSWLDEFFEPLDQSEELGPDEAALTAAGLTDPGSQPDLTWDEIEKYIQDFQLEEEPEEGTEDIAQPQSEEIPETDIEDITQSQSEEVPEETVEESAQSQPEEAISEPAQETEPDTIPQMQPEQPFRDDEFVDTFGEGTELDQIFSDEPLPLAPPVNAEVEEDNTEETTEEPPMKKGRPKRKKGYGLLGIPHILVTLVWLAIIAVIGVTLGRMMWLCVADVLAFGQIPREATIVITEDDSLDSIAKKLHNAKLINYPGLFTKFAELTGKGERISVGTFTFNEPDPDTGKIPGTIYDYNAIINALREYAPTREVVQVVIPEGYSCAQLFALLEEKGVSTVAELEEHAANGELKEYWFLENVERGSKYCLEGFLFPDTYQFYTNDDPQRVLEKFLNNFNVKFSDLMMEKMTVLNEKLTAIMEERGFSAEKIAEKQITVREIVIIASMVEKETGGALESYDISSVIYNRLYRWELPYLNIDATIVYALGGKTDPLTVQDLQVDSPFNTYTHMGLTPGAISNPGLTSLNAALDPNDTDYFYYALNPETNEHKFSETEKEHNDFLAKIKEKQNEQD